MARVVGLLGVAPLAAALNLAPAAGKARYASGDPCACLNWKDTYATHRVACGEYAELGFHVDYRTNLSLQEIGWNWMNHPRTMSEVCNKYLARLDDDSCLNTDESLGPTWCYVSSECKHLNNGTRVADKVDGEGKVAPRNISVKICNTSTNDVDLRSRTPKEMKDMAKKHKMSLGVLVLNNYVKLWPQEGQWAQLEQLWTQGAFSKMPKTVQEGMAHNVPIVVYCGGDMLSQLKIIWGTTLIHLDADPSLCPETTHCYSKEPTQFVARS